MFNIRFMLTVALLALLVLSSAKAVISIDFFEHLTDNINISTMQDNWLAEDPKTSQTPDLMVVKADEGFESPHDDTPDNQHPKATSDKDKLYAVFRSSTTL